MFSMKKIGVFTSGGDSPGMNAAIRSVVRTAYANNIQTFGIYEGFQGLIDNDFTLLSPRYVSNILQRGGTILRSARCMEFKTKAGRKKAYDNVVKNEIDALVVIGGDGSFTGASIFYEEFGIPYVGLPGTIDNDLFGTDFTIGFDTALNTIVEAVDRIKDTAASHNRLFFIEVMGRDTGYLALNAGVATGAEDVLVPEEITDVEELVHHLIDAKKQKKNSSIVIVAEGDDSGGAMRIAEQVKSMYNQFDTRVTILGHIQRGGRPTANDRILASRLGNAGVHCLLKGKTDIMLGLVNGEIQETDVREAIERNKILKKHLLLLIDELSN
jgi:6-phosphofructokinase 1